jgi:hypothetical protein
MNLRDKYPAYGKWMKINGRVVNECVGTSHTNIKQHMSVAMQRLVDFISMVTTQYVTTQQSFNALLAGFTVGRSIRDIPLLFNG